MKVAFFAVFAACVALGYSAPATQAVDWAAVGQKVSKIEQDITRAVQEVKAIANADNAQVGAVIARKLDAAAVRARAVLEAASQAIRDQTLTQAQAQAHFNDLKDVLAELQQDLSSEVSQLSPEAANRIRATLNTALEQVTVTAREVLALLQGTFTFVIDWTAVQTRLHEIRNQLNTGLEQIKAIALGDNPVVGTQIVAKINASQGQAYAILGQTEGLIKDQTLTEAQASVNLNQLNDVLESTIAGLQNELAQLSASAMERIRNAYTTAFNAAKQSGDAMLELLRQ